MLEQLQNQKYEHTKIHQKSTLDWQLADNFLNVFLQVSGLSYSEDEKKLSQKLYHSLWISMVKDKLNIYEKNTTKNTQNRIPIDFIESEHEFVWMFLNHCEMNVYVWAH